MSQDRPRQNRISQELIVRFVAGDKIAFKRVFDELQKDVFFVVRRLFRSPFDQQEAEQEVWLHLYRMRSQIDVNRDAEFVGWVKQVARNKTIDMLKKRYRQSEIPVEEISDFHEDIESAQQPKAVMGDKIRRAVNDFIDSLDHESRRFFPLCFFQELSHQEISDELGISVRQSKYLKQKLLARLVELPLLKAYAEGLR